MYNASDNNTQKGKNLTFIVNNETYGIDIKYVRQIIGVQKITIIPNQPKYLKGVINLRGEIVPVMDVSLRFGKDEIAFDDRTCFIVVDIDNTTVGLIVERVSEVIVLNDENISDPPDFNNDMSNRFVRGIGKIGDEVYILLNSSELLK
ncbi:purine-binding chemotaxis protein CheW [Clostridium sp. 'deep sea']|uniref:chemotaxis protein CheW n=1 Tax=Clostridium sp. 'deep sea' TaxID=2779445 RepID=UPI0018965D8E|nr:chemotaxis protein CheW [Clostridium sp. 'deep sea']QOR35329.1 purine-binding chemotaxis protein CheW [Clostridium sp. 'deep sea']